MNRQIAPFLDLTQNLRGYSSTNTCAFDKSSRIQTCVDPSTLCASITGKPRPWILLPSASFSPCCPKCQNQSLEHMELHSGDTCTSDFSKLSCPVSCEVTLEKSLVQVIYLRHSTGVNRQIAPFLVLTQNSPPPHGNGATCTDNLLTHECYGSNKYTVQKSPVQVIWL